MSHLQDLTESSLHFRSKALLKNNNKSVIFKVLSSLFHKLIIILLLFTIHTYIYKIPINIKLRLPNILLQPPNPSTGNKRSPYPITSLWYNVLCIIIITCRCMCCFHQSLIIIIIIIGSSRSQNKVHQSDQCLVNWFYNCKL